MNLWGWEGFTNATLRFQNQGKSAAQYPRSPGTSFTNESGSVLNTFGNYRRRTLRCRRTLRSFEGNMQYLWYYSAIKLDKIDLGFFQDWCNWVGGYANIAFDCRPHPSHPRFCFFSHRHYTRDSYFTWNRTLVLHLPLESIQICCW